jgi:hypothetical protein
MTDDLGGPASQPRIGDSSGRVGGWPGGLWVAVRVRLGLVGGAEVADGAHEEIEAELEVCVVVAVQ